MSGVSELLFRHDTTDCFTETCLNHEQYASLMAPYAENDDLEEFFLGAFASLADIRKEGVVLRSNEETVEFKNIKAEERVYLAPQVEISLPHTLYANGDSRLYMELNGVVSGLTSPASSAVSMNGSVSPTHGVSENFNGLALDHLQTTPSFHPQLFDETQILFDASKFFQLGDQSTSAGVIPVSPGINCLAPSSLPSPIVPPPSQLQVSGNELSQYYPLQYQDVPSSTIGGIGGGQPWTPLQIDASSATMSVDYEDPVDVMHLQKRTVFVPIQQQGGAGDLLQREESDIVDYHLGVQPRSNRRPSMLRSQSSHTLGQDQPVMHLLSPQSESSSLNLQGVQPEFTGQVTSPRPHLQSQHSDLEDMVRAAYMAAPLMRRAQSTGDLQRPTVTQVGGGNLSPMYGDTKRVGRFTLEERRQLLQRFQQKRTQRNFNKKIKYACRKSLADKRPRVRGRFARNDESTEHSSRTNGHKLEDDDEADTTMGEEDEFLMNQSSSGDFLDLRELPVKLERLEP
ncbi:hypothetical protein BDL97_13G026500 [Sphagnum fallax]|nr:hypothetical protein BDL97_13G026500 [Sphagnum fallax]